MALASSGNVADHAVIAAKIRTVKVIVVVANCVFYLGVLCFVLLAEFSSYMPKKDVYLYMDGVNKCIAAGLLIYSIVRFKILVRRMGESKDFYSSERLMKLHLAIFITYILTFFGYCLTRSIEEMHHEDWFSKKPLWLNNDLNAYCRNTIANSFFNCFCVLMNQVILALLCYLSIKFSEPLENY